MERQLSLQRINSGKKPFFRSLIFGGTFDRFHAGHLMFLLVSRVITEYLGLGLVSDTMLEKKNKAHGEILRDYTARKETVTRKALDCGFKESNAPPVIEIISIDGDHGLGDVLDVNAIVVSQETYLVALEMNKSRKAKGLHPLEIVVIPDIHDENGNRLSSTKMRESELKS
ncbi:MAG: hypothetical protein ACTSP4_07240 [Candidatus Hodarchaeales archaeon]